MLTTYYCTAFLCSLALPARCDRDWKRDGAFGFPQKDATVLCDTPELRVSACNDGVYLYVQAVIPGDGNDALGEAEDGRELGDNSQLLVDVDADGQETPKTDRDYSLNPWPSMPGLYYQVVVDERTHTGLTDDSNGRGAISYVPTGDGQRARVDSFLIPLAEIARKSGDEIRVAYFGRSTKPDLTVNSVGHRSEEPYYGRDLPREKFHRLTLATREAALDAQAVPDPRAETFAKAAAEAAASKGPPSVGSVPPEIDASEWLHWKGAKPPTLASLAGKVVVVEFWATWCGPCVRGIPHLNAVHDRYADKGLVILSLTNEPKKVVEPFLVKRPMKYAVGIGSRTVHDYEVRGIPMAFVLGRDSKVAWMGHPQDDQFEATIKRLLEKP